MALVRTCRRRRSKRHQASDISAAQQGSVSANVNGQILNHLGLESEQPNITAARGLPLWNEFDAHDDEGVQPAPSWDDAAQAAPDFELDQRVSW
jgi:hypothetical protein